MDTAFLAGAFDHELTTSIPRYRDCSRYSLQLGQTSKALKYARQELEMEQSLFGTDTEHFRENLYGAKYWLEDLEKKAGIKA